MKSFRVIVKEVNYSEAVIVADSEQEASDIACRLSIETYFPLQDIEGFEIESIEEIEEVTA
jgi:D-hexose-6-phosphate mutarotase